MLKMLLNSTFIDPFQLVLYLFSSSKHCRKEERHFTVPEECQCNALLVWRSALVVFEGERVSFTRSLQTLSRAPASSALPLSLFSQLVVLAATKTIFLEICFNR